jgi:hypothetical protein
VSVLNVVTSGNQGHGSINTSGGYGTLIGLFEDKANHWHGTTVSHGAEGHVRWHIKNADALIDAHGNGPHATLLDDSQGGFAFNDGGNVKNMPNHYRHFVLWNYKSNEARSNTRYWDDRPGSYWYEQYYVKPIIVGTHGSSVTFDESYLQVLESNGTAVNPKSLFEAQLARRLGSVPAWLMQLKADFDTPANQGFVPDTDKWYRLQSRWSDHFLRARGDRNGGGEVRHMAIQQGWTTPQWRFEFARSEGGKNYYRIKNKWSGLYLKADISKPNGGPVEHSAVEPAWASPDWHLEFAHNAGGADYYRLQNRSSDLYLRARGDQASGGVVEHQAAEPQWHTAQWRLEEVDTNVRITSLAEEADIAKESMLQVYPNPSKGSIQIEWTNEQAEVANMRISDISGMVVLNGELRPGPSTLDLSRYTKGMYLLSVHTATSVMKQKILLE